MLLTQQPTLRNFWYPVAPMEELKKGPIPFVLLGEKIVLWLDQNGNPAAAKDQCCHRGALLSRGWVNEQGCITCPYHAWAYDRTGTCTQIPQIAQHAIPKTYCVDAYLCEQKYDHVWVCLGDPIRPIPEIPEAKDPNYRSFPCFWERWETSSLRVIENELDMAHFAVVHTGTFGNPEVPMPLSLDIKEMDDYTIHVQAELSVKAPAQQMKNTGAKSEKTTRLMNVTWHMPFFIRLQISYPSGLNHIIINHPTPINDHQIQVVQFCFRNDTEEQVTKKEILSFERLILNEDRSVLETTPPEVFLETHREMHILTDKPGLLVRKKLARVLSNKETVQKKSHPEENLTI